MRSARLYLAFEILLYMLMAVQAIEARYANRTLLCATRDIELSVHIIPTTMGQP